MYIFFFLISGSLLGLNFQTPPSNDKPDNLLKVKNSFKKGEKLEYKVNVGIFTAAEGEMIIHDEMHQINGKACYKIDVFGRTVGAIDWLAKVNDQWGAYLDTASLMPQVTYRDIREGKYRKKEVVRFDHQENVVKYLEIDDETGEYKAPKYYRTPENVKDLISGYTYLRSLDFDQYTLDDTIKFHAFFEDTVYHFKILYKGKDQVRTRVGKFNAIKLTPVMPDNDIFSGNQPVDLWLSDDPNKIPLKAVARMFFGRAGCVLSSYEGLKYPMNKLEGG